MVKFFFCIFEIKLFCFLINMSDLVHYVVAIHGLCELHLELQIAVSQASPNFKKNF